MFKSKSNSTQNFRREVLPSMENFELFRSLSDPEISSSEFQSKLSDKMSDDCESIESSSCASFNFRDEQIAKENNLEPIVYDDCMRPSEEMISLSHIEESMMKHKYTASRGQRERDVEWCELVPCRMMVRKTKKIVRILE